MFNKRKVHVEECACSLIPKKEPASEIKKCSDAFRKITNLSGKIEPTPAQTRHIEARAYYLAALERVKNTPEPAGQKFHIGERVWIGFMPPYMSHFKHNCWATVEYTYAHAFGGNDVNNYSLKLDTFGSCSWYEEDQLTREKDLLCQD